MYVHTGFGTARGWNKLAQFPLGDVFPRHILSINTSNDLPKKKQEILPLSLVLQCYTVPHQCNPPNLSKLYTAPNNTTPQNYIMSPTIQPI